MLAPNGGEIERLGSSFVLPWFLRKTPHRSEPHTFAFHDRFCLYGYNSLLFDGYLACYQPLSDTDASSNSRIPVSSDCVFSTAGLATRECRKAPRVDFKNVVIVLTSAKLNVPAITIEAFEQRPDGVLTITHYHPLSRFELSPPSENRAEFDKPEASEQSGNRGTGSQP